MRDMKKLLQVMQLMYGGTRVHTQVLGSICHPFCSNTAICQEPMMNTMLIGKGCRKGKEKLWQRPTTVLCLVVAGR